jgi:putative transposase
MSVYYWVDVDPLSLACGSPKSVPHGTIDDSSRGQVLSGSMLRLLVALLPTLRSAMRSRRDLVIENLALRQQLGTLASRRHPDIRAADRVFWILLRGLWSGWAESLAIVRPDTVVRWHRAGFHIYWYWLSRRGPRSGRPPLPREVRALIRRMATENSWGAPRIHGELQCLGFEVSERSVSRYLRSLPRAPRAGQTWTTFLRNHRNGIAAMDFSSVPTATFRVFQVLFIIRHGRRDMVRCAVTTTPTAGWVAQHLRDAFPFETAPRFMIFDRGTIFSVWVMATIRSMKIGPTRTSFRSPWQNGVAERFVATVRRELLDHVIVLYEHHLRRLLDSFIDHYNQDRTHLGLSKDSPLGRPVEQRPAGATSSVVSLPRVGGLHHRYAWRQAA